MAAIQSIRSKGKLLITIIGIALLAFITEEFFSATEAQRNQESGVVGTINGKKFKSQEYSKMIDAYKSYLGITQQKTTFTEDEDAAIKEQVWQEYVSQKLIEAEAEKLGLTVTDQELRNVLNEGTHPYLTQTLFVNESGRFDATSYKNFLDQYKAMKSNTQTTTQDIEQAEKIKQYCLYIEKNLRQYLLLQKYNVLAQVSVTSNPIEGKLAFESMANSADLYCAAVPYTAVADKDVEPTEAELKAKYNELKESFKLLNDVKDIKYVAVTVKASAADKQDLEKKMQEFADEVASGSDISGLVRRSQSTVAYLDLPRTAEAYPKDIRAELDSMAVGSIKAPYYNPSDNTMNLIKLIAKTQAPDSIQMRQIQVGGKDLDDARKRADSVYAALQGGADFGEIAKKYGQSGDSVWTVSNMYETSQMDENFLTLFNKVQDAQVGQMVNVEFPQGNIILLVTDRKKMVTKYNAAVIKCPLNYSNETSKKEYNKFSKFVAENKTLESIEKNAAKSGYMVQELRGIETSDFFSMNYFSQPGTERHMMRWISNDARKWIFDEAKDGDVSQLFTCGNGSHLLVVCVTKSYEAGYMPLDGVKDYLKAEVMRDKKAEILVGKLKNAKSVQQVLSTVKEAQADTMKAINFYSTSMDPALVGSTVNLKQGQFVGPIKGYGGVYAYQVIGLNKSADAKYDEGQAINQAARTHAGMAMSSRNPYGESPILTFLKSKAKIADNRYRLY